jgi:hypothetical protein
MSTTTHCDRCGGNITNGVRAIYEGFHPIPEKTPQFRMSIEFYEKLSSKKADLCRACMVELAKEKINEVRP